MSSYNNDPIQPAGEPYVPVAAGGHDAPYDSLTGLGADATAKERARDAADSVAGPAAQVKDTAVSAGADVKDSAVSATKDVAGAAKAEAAEVVGEAKVQGRALLDQSMNELRHQAGDVQNRLAGVVRSFADELGAMANTPEANGPMAQFASTGQRFTADAASFLENNDLDDVVYNVRRYAARNPWTFLAIAGGVGLVAGRLARGLKDADGQPYGTLPAQRTRSLYAGYQPGTSGYEPGTTGYQAGTAGYQAGVREDYAAETYTSDVYTSEADERSGEWGRA